MIKQIGKIAIKFLDRSHLDIKKIITIYLYALIIIPLFFATFILLEMSITKQSISTILITSPIVTVDMIVTINDFVFGYYLWFKKANLLADLGSCHFFMICQLISQILVGNLFCAVLAIFGIIRTRNVDHSYNECNKALRLVDIIFLTIFIFCFLLIVLISIKK